MEYDEIENVDDRHVQEISNAGWSESVSETPFAWAYENVNAAS